MGLANGGERVAFDGSTGNTAGSILDLVRTGEAASRSDLARVTGLARSTVGQRVDSLIALGLVKEVGENSSTGGRPSTRLRFDENSGVVLAADLGATHCRIALTDLGGNVLAEEPADLPISAGPTAVLGWALEHFATLLDRAGRNRSEVKGIGIGVPGPVDFDAGRAINPPLMPGWHNFDIPGFFAERYGHIPVLVDNDVNIMAYGEFWTHWRGRANDFVFLKIATGIGMGIVSGSELRRGARGAAGDIGHVHASDDPDAICACGNAGCLEAVASGTALAAQLHSLGHESISGARDVVKLVHQANPTAVRLVRDAGRSIGNVLAVAVNILNPAVIVVGGDLAQAQEQLFAGMREAIYQQSNVLATERLQIQATRLGDRAGVIGGAALVIEKVLSVQAVDSAVAAKAVA